MAALPHFICIAFASHFSVQMLSSSSHPLVASSMNRSLKHSSHAYSAPALMSVKGDNANSMTENPVSYLRSIFPEHLKRQRCQITSISDEEIDNYDMETVRAIRDKDLPSLRRMLEEGKSFEACNRNGETLLHLACRRGDVDTVKFLIEEASVDVNKCDDMGRSILHDVCWRPRPDTELMGMLLRRMSPDVLLAEDTRGHTPFDYVRREHWGVWVAFLKEKTSIIKLRLTFIEAISAVA